MEDMNLRHIIKEALTKTDENKIGVMIRKEIKDAKSEEDFFVDRGGSGSDGGGGCGCSL